MKTKKSILSAMLMLCFAIILIAVIPMIFGSITIRTASASSNNKLRPKAKSTISHYINNEVVSVGKGEGNVWGIYHSESKGVTYVSLSIWKQNASSSDSYVNGEYGLGLPYQDITIKFETGHLNQRLTLLNSSGDVIATKTNDNDINVTLDEGEYCIVLTAYANSWTRKDGKKENYVLEAEFMFHIDLTAPLIYGTFPQGEEQWVGIGHTVEAKDDLGIRDFYVTQPDGSFKRFSGIQSYTFQAEDKEGLYTFHALDNTGYDTGVRTVLFDRTAPSGCFNTENGEVLETDGDVNQSFSFQATDELSGLREIKYKTPSSDSWEEYTSGTIIPNNVPMGKYEFRCIDVVGNESVYSINLSHDFVAKVTAPTCSTGGFTTYSCNDCGYSHVGEQIPALGHKYSDTRVAATCAEKGYTLHRCARCNYEYRDTPVRELGHDMQPSTILPSCTGSGYLVYSCTRCNESNRTETAKPLGHNYITQTAAATCTEGSYTLHECTRCGDSYKDNVALPNGHNFVVSHVLPTCTEYGKTRYECQVCDYCYDDSDGTYPTGHSYTISVIKEPTCTEEGLRRSCCEDCGHTFDTVIAPNGHEYEITDVESANGKTARIYTCSICGHSYRQELGNQYEEVSNYIEYLFKQYEPYMWWVLLATAGIWSIAIGVMIAIAQKHEDKEKAKKMLVNYVIGLVAIAVIVVACPYLVRGIAALIT